MKNILVLIAIGSLIGCATTAPSGSKGSTEQAAIAYTLSGVPGARPTLKGNPKTAQVSIVAFEDFECPFCAKANKTITKLQESYGEKLQVVFMHNPLAFHKLALPAAMLAAAADKQGKFWEVHDLLFEAEGKLSGEVFDGVVTRSGLDMETLEKDFSNPDLIAFVKRSQAIAADLGVAGTPSFLVNGHSLGGAKPFEAFQAIIDAELKLADKADRRGESWIKERQAANKPKLNGYLYEGKVPPALPNQEPEEPELPEISETVYKVSVHENDGQIGPKDAPVTLVIFSEFECPYCAKIKPTLKKLQEVFGSKLRIVFKHNPLAFHEHAKGASEAALCAKEQGKFWEMHDTLFAHQDKLGADDLKGYARELGLDPARFSTCMQERRFSNQIAQDQALAASVGARGTPNSFVNGRQIQGAQPQRVFEAIIGEELKKAEAQIAKGADPSGLYAHIISTGKEFPDLSNTVNNFTVDQTAIQGDWVNAPMKIMVFSDFQCPYCSKVAPILEKVRKRLGWKVSIGFKHFPLSFHPLARPAAQAAICAQEQGKFWEYHDAIFESQESWTPSVFEETAKRLKLNVTAFGSCLNDTARLNAIIDKDVREGEAADVGGTPSIYINGRKMDAGGGLSAEIFEKLVDGKLKQTVSEAAKNAPKNACRLWLQCLGSLANMDKKGLGQLKSVAKTLEKQAKSGSKGVLAACRAGMKASLQSFPGSIPDACK